MADGEPAGKNLPPADEMLSYYKDMLLIRRFEGLGSFTGWA